MKVFKLIVMTFLVMSIFSSVLALSVNAEVRAGADRNGSNVSVDVRGDVKDRNISILFENESERMGLLVANLEEGLKKGLFKNDSMSEKVKINFENFTKNWSGKDGEIKIMPSTASQTAIAKLRLHACSEQNNCTIEFKEVGNGDNVKLGYQVDADQDYKILGLFRSRAHVSTTVDAASGEVIETHKPWWVSISTSTENKN